MRTEPTIIPIISRFDKVVLLPQGSRGKPQSELPMKEVLGFTERTEGILPVRLLLETLNFTKLGMVREGIDPEKWLFCK